MISLHQTDPSSQFPPFQMVKAPLERAPFTPVPKAVVAGIQLAAQRHYHEPWYRPNVPYHALWLYLELQARDRAARGAADYVPATVATTTEELSRAIGVHPKALQRACRLLTAAGVLAVKRRGGWRDGLPSCIGSVYTFADHAVHKRPPLPDHGVRNHNGLKRITNTKNNRHSWKPSDPLAACRHQPGCKSAYVCYRLREIDEALLEGKIPREALLSLRAAMIGAPKGC